MAHMRLSAAVCLTAMLFGSALSGQNDDSGTRSVQGVVADASRKPLAGAVVQLKDTKSLQVRSYVH